MRVQVTREEFYRIIGPMDVITVIPGGYPYTTVIKTRDGLEVARAVNIGCKYPTMEPLSEYYVESEYLK